MLHRFLASDGHNCSACTVPYSKKFTQRGSRHPITPKILPQYQQSLVSIRVSDIEEIQSSNHARVEVFNNVDRRILIEKEISLPYSPWNGPVNPSF